jgi:hypothetical protein
LTAASRVALQLCYPRSMTATAFDNLDDYLPLPRVSGMAVSADGPWVVTTVAELNDKSTEYITADGVVVAFLADHLLGETGELPKYSE